MEGGHISAILHSIQTGKFTDSSLKELLFPFLNRQRGELIIGTLLQAAAEVGTQTAGSFDMEQVRIGNTHQHIVKLLANTAGNRDFYNNDDKRTVLHYASEYGWLWIVQSLLKEGADVNAKDRDGITSVYLATCARHRDVVNLLVESGAGVLSRTCTNHTLLHAASATGWIDFVQFLLKQGADPNAEDSDWLTPLYVAVMQLQRDSVALLIDSGADTASGCLLGSVLHFAVDKSTLEIVKCLVEKGAGINNQFNGFTPLRVACIKQKISMIEYLVNVANIQSKSNETPLKFIMKHHANLTLIKKYVERYGYLSNFIDDYYGAQTRNLSFKKNIFQNPQVCTEAVINKFNYKDLPAFYNLPLPVGTLPPIQNLMIASEGIIQDIEQSVRHEINTSGICDLGRPKVIVLRMLAVASYVDYYNGLIEKS